MNTLSVFNKSIFKYFDTGRAVGGAVSARCRLKDSEIVCYHTATVNSYYAVMIMMMTMMMMIIIIFIFRFLCDIFGLRVANLILWPLPFCGTNNIRSYCIPRKGLWGRKESNLCLNVETSSQAPSYASPKL